MSTARNLAALLDSSGDVVLEALDNAVGGGGGAWEVVSSTTLVGTITSIVYALTGYTNFMIIMDGVKSVDSSIRIEFSTDGGSTYLSSAGDYRNAAGQIPSNSSAMYFYTANTDQAGINVYLNSTRSMSAIMNISVADPTTAFYQATGYTYNSSERYHATGLSALHSGTATHIRLLTPQATGFSAGTFTLYGIKTS